MTLVQEAPTADRAESAPRGLAPTPPDSATSDGARRAFRAMNHYFMVPALKAGLGPWIGTPLSGWILLLRVRGRKSGILRDNPLSYLIADGAVWVMAGFGTRTDWYRNLLADPEVELLLPGRAIACRAQEVDSPYIRARIIPRLVRATGAMSFLSGINPYRSTDDQMLAATAWVPLIRLAPEDELLVAGPDDPGGLGWLWRQAVLLGAGLLLGRGLRAIARR